MREGAGHWRARIAAYGRLAGSTLHALGFDAHRDIPRLRSHDRFGQRIDVVEFHPNYHAVMDTAVSHGVAGLSWCEPRTGSHVARAALSYLHYQVEPGSSCPLTMTHAAVPVLRMAPALGTWAEKACAPHYDPRNAPIEAKAGITLGMGMTEKQGGSDVRSNRTTASPMPDGSYRLVGHKWFFSAPMSDGFLVLAQTASGLSCFLMPRWRPDGTRNAFRLVRLKDKLGDRSNASSEVEFDGAWAWRIGEEGRGVATIIPMVMLTRLDCMLGSAALMRMAVAQAIHHARYRHAFGRALVAQPLMRNVLADLAIEAEAALALAMRVARAVDAGPQDPAEAAFARVATAIGKYWICKRAPAFVSEAQECLGGGGYIEESLLARLYRQAPLNAIWEGSGNIQCLDVLRALEREPACRAALHDELGAGTGMPDEFRRGLEATLAATSERNARRVVERLALGLQAVALERAASPLAGDFIRSRIEAPHALGFGTLADGLDEGRAIDRVLPAG